MKKKVGRAIPTFFFSSYYYIRRGDLPNDGTRCGILSINASGAFSDTGWYFGAALE